MAEEKASSAATKSMLRSRMNKKKSGSSFGTQEPVGAGTKLQADMTKQSFNFNKFLDSRRLLKIPQGIQEANPDKHFAWVKADDLMNSGGFHQYGYNVYRRPKKGLDHDNDVADFGSNGFSMDSVVRNRELVLAWIPKEEKAERDLGYQIMRKRSLGQGHIEDNPELAGTDATAEVKREQITFKE